MKGIRLKIFILSALLLTVASGAFFLKNLTFLEPPLSPKKLDFYELKTIDKDIQNAMYSLRFNVTPDFNDYQVTLTKIQEWLYLLKDIPSGKSAEHQAIEKIKSYLEQKKSLMIGFEKKYKMLNNHLKDLHPQYNELNTQNLKFIVDKKDFYRECMLDLYMYLAKPSKENELRIKEDQKIIEQVINFSNIPNQKVLNYSKTIDSIFSQTKNLQEDLIAISTDTITNELETVLIYNQRVAEEQKNRNHLYFRFMFGAIITYLIAMAVILKRN